MGGGSGLRNVRCSGMEVNGGMLVAARTKNKREKIAYDKAVDSIHFIN